MTIPQGPGENQGENQGAQPVQPGWAGYGSLGPMPPAQMPLVERPPMPASVDTASKAMVAGAVVSFVLSLLSLTTTGTVRKNLENQHKFTHAEIDSAVTVIQVSAVVFGLIGAALWIWMAWATRRGRNWARITSTVFFGAGVVGQLINLPGDSPGWLKGLDAISLLIGLVAIVFLWKKESGPYFRA